VSKNEICRTIVSNRLDYPTLWPDWLGAADSECRIDWVRNRCGQFI